jgi:phage shock protein A
MDDDGAYALDVLDASYDTLARAADLDAQIAVRDPDQPDASAQWQALRARYQRPQPSPRQPANDMRAARQDFECSWNEWADGRIAAALNQHARMYDKAVGRALGRATAKLRDEIATLRRALATARNRIKELEQQRNVKIASWHINRKLFTATPFDANGKAGPTINLRPLFEEYHVQTS